MNLVCDNRIFILKSDDGEQLSLFNPMDLKSNCSRLCFHNLTAEGNIVPVMYEFLMKTVGELNDGNSRNALFSAVAYLIILGELIKKYRAYRILYMGKISPLTKYLAQLLQMINSGAMLCCITEEDYELDEPNVVMIHCDCSRFPFPQDYFDVVLTNEICPDIIREVFPAIIAAAVPGGLFITLPAIQGDDSWLEGFAKSIGEIPGNRMMYLNIPIEKIRLLRNFDNDLLVIKKDNILNQFLEIEHGLALLDESASHAADSVLVSLIMKVEQIESDISEIYENLVSLHVKYKVNLFKEALIKYRIEYDKKKLYERKTRIDDCFQQLKEELKVDFYRYFV